MRIIDKNTDFYDYLQGIYRDDSIVFDRTDSFELTKDIMRDHLHMARMSGPWRDREIYDFVLLQVCHTFWLFLVETKIDKGYDWPTDYTAELIAKWQNHNAKRSLIKLSVIDFDWSVSRLLYSRSGPRRYDRTRILGNADALTQVINQNNYRIKNSVDKHTIYKGNDTRVEKHIPLLKSSGFAKCIDPLDVYLALEEYFSLVKSDMERTESAGLTDEEKIGNHGFDLKTSFRGK